ncbi:twin-arginine translocation signal domain-containing protein, partial [Bradyrhizobium sp. WBAH30]
MADHPTISTVYDLASPTLPTTAVTRRSLLGGAGIAVGAAVLASPPGMSGVAPAAAQTVGVGMEARPLDAAFKRRAFEVRAACASNNE